MIPGFKGLETIARFQKAKLFKLLGLLQLTQRQRRIGRQHIAAIAVNADVSPEGDLLQPAILRQIADEGNWAAREIEGFTRCCARDFDAGGTEDFLKGS